MKNTSFNPSLNRLKSLALSLLIMIWTLFTLPIRFVFMLLNLVKRKGEGINLEEVSVDFDQEGIKVVWPDGETPYARWDDIHNVFIETTDEGPWQEDAWWCLSVADYAIRIPNCAKGLGELIEELITRGADEKTIVQAMSCTNNKTFLILNNKSSVGG